MSRCSASSVLAAFAIAVPAAADVRLEVSGAVEAGPPRLEVRVDLANRGDLPAAALSVEGELLGRRDRAHLEALPAGQTSSALLRFDVGAPRPGVYPLALHLQYSRPGAPTVEASQRAYLLLALGASAPPAVRIAVPDVRIDVTAPVVARLESADARPHRVRLRLLTPRGLQPFGPEPEAQVPASGTASAELRLLRGTAPRPSRQGIVVLAETVGEEMASASAATAVVDVQPDPARLPRLRRPLAAAAVALLVAALYVELRRKRRSSSST